MAISIINLEAGMPTVKLARSRLNQGLQSARMRGEKAVKIIHGYGSTTGSLTGPMALSSCGS